MSFTWFFFVFMYDLYTKTSARCVTHSTAMAKTIKQIHNHLPNPPPHQFSELGHLDHIYKETLLNKHATTVLCNIKHCPIGWLRLCSCYFQVINYWLKTIQAAANRGQSVHMTNRLWTLNLECNMTTISLWTAETLYHKLHCIICW